MIRVCEPNIGKKEFEYVKKCFDTNWISSQGPFVTEFEKKFAEYCDTKYGTSATNGTTALHLACATLGIGPGDEVIMPTFTMIASPNSVIYTGARPVWVDSEMETWNMDVPKIEKNITKKNKDIMVVHTFGLPVDMDPVLEIAKKHNLKVIEDAAESHGALYKGKKVGGIGDVGCFSFYANKLLTTGEGGMITTNNEEYSELAHTLMNHAFSKERHFWHKHIGFNYRLTNLQAAIGLAQLERAEELLNLKLSVARRYTKALTGVNGITTPPQANWAKNTYWMYGILVDKKKFGISKDDVMKELEKKGIETREFFIPMHTQPIYKKMGLDKGKYPIAERLNMQGLYLPSGTMLTEEQIHYICETLIKLKKK
ncbi:MAG: DegT/DnrJ/EryC1/StrS family aminotransferase [archaeon]|nr:DegT/DnrJ/EryC1/StrS family aminotransferase [archaeon]